jgi:N-methylhydantoinase A
MADVRHSMVAPFMVACDTVDPEEAEATLSALAEESRGRLLRDGIPPEAVSFERFADMRYYGQAYELAVPCDEVLSSGNGPLARLVASFHAQHDRVYGHHADDEPVQFVNLRVDALGRVPRGTWKPPPRRVRHATRTRSVYVCGAGWQKASVLDRGSLEMGQDYAGTMIVEQPDSTVWIPPGDVATVDAHGNIIVEVAQ